jgi:endoglucanase
MPYKTKARAMSSANKALLISVCGLALLCNAVLAEPQPFRGFTIACDKMTPETLEVAKRDWNANIFRVMLRPGWYAKFKKLDSSMDGWNALMKELPQFLDKAKELDAVVVLALFEVPNERIKNYVNKTQTKSEFWNDETNLETMKLVWRQLAELCAGRDQEIWFDLFNEPLNWDEKPLDVPKNWPRWAQELADEVRKVDGRHALVIETGPGGLCSGFKSFPPLKGDNIIYSVHEYSPHQYTHQGISNIANTDLEKAYLDSGLTWPFKDDNGRIWTKESLRQELLPVVEFQKRNNARIFVGEFSVVRWAPNGCGYLKDCMELFEEYGWSWTYHGFRESSIWSLEHSDLKESKDLIEEQSKQGERAKVVRKYLGLNAK